MSLSLCLRLISLYRLSLSLLSLCVLSNAIFLLLLSSSLSEPEGAEGAGGAEGTEGAGGAEGAGRTKGASGAEGAKGAGGAEGAEEARDPPSKLHLLKEYRVKKYQCTPQTTAC